MKKSICVIVMVVILFNFIFCNNAYATADDKPMFEGDSSITNETITPGDQEGIINDGKVTTETNSNPISLEWDILGNLFGGTVAAIIVGVLNIFPMLVQLVMKLIVGSDLNFSIESTVFNLIPLFNINYFNFDKTYTVGEEQYENDFAIKTLRESVAKSFMIIRLIAIAISLLVLIYVGIRMAISSVASDKSKYKKMFMGWVESVIILFLMQYIISILFFIGERFGDMFYSIKVGMDASGGVNFEEDIMNSIFSSLLITSGWEYVMYSVMYWVLIFIQTKFFVMYFRRVIVVGFLILIAPAVTVTYPIDKAGDGKAQAFSVWFAELIVNIMIQPIHALIYLVFMYTAGEIAKHSMLVALIFLLSMTKVEGYVLKLFNLRNVVSLKPVDEERKKGI